MGIFWFNNSIFLKFASEIGYIFPNDSKDVDHYRFERRRQV